MGDVYMVNGKILSGLPNHAKDIEFDNTGTTLNSTNTEDAIKEVNSNLTKMRSTRILAISTSDIPSGGNVTVPDISNYKALFFALVGGNGTSINGSAFIPTDIFNLGGILVVPNQGAQTLATFKYISDTVINMDYPGSNIHIYGIK